MMAGNKGTHRPENRQREKRKTTHVLGVNAKGGVIREGGRRQVSLEEGKLRLDGIRHNGGKKKTQSYSGGPRKKRRDQNSR